EARGLRHLAFEVEDINQAIEDLEKENIPVEPIRVDELTGKRFTFFCDPDDLSLEIYGKYYLQ
ncbi:VOC family protein, partial [Peribacillus frigoritolerans]|uniref:VOC family protein n=1 Tax=Peribacillus frigoritolerans TaxID=450367 RepID=UPI00300A108E